MKTALIINPVAGRGRTKKIWPKLESYLQSTNMEWKAFFTTLPGDAVRLARELPRQGYTRLGVLGGDGTIHEVINGLDFESTQLAVVPTGTGNDFCRSAGIPKEPLQALQLLQTGLVEQIDVGQVNGSYFLNVVGVGFDAEVAKATNEDFQNLTGITAYLAALLKVLKNHRNAEITIQTEAAVFNGQMLLAAVGNGKYLGSGMRIVPEARLGDGLFHLCLIGDVSKGEILTTFPKIFSGKHLEHPKVSSVTARKVTITSRKPLPVQADGEIIGNTPVNIEILPGRLKILVPTP